MDNNVQKHFTCNFKQIIIDEIALEGLEGIGINYLWKRVENRLSLILTQKMKNRFWRYIINREGIKFYQLPEPVPYIEVVDRFMLIDSVTGYVKDPDDYIDGPYEYNLVDGEYGSSKNYNTRKLLSRSQLQQISFDKIMAEYGDTLVMVASIEERWHALAGHMPMLSLYQLSPIHYCILELVGRGRENGQMTFGKTNITKIVKDKKILFYNRKVLQDLDLIRVQYVSQLVAERGVKCLLLRLKKFHQPSILSLPKVGILHDLVEYLRAQPDYSEKTDVLLKKDLLTPKQSKRLRKTVNVFNFDERVDDSVKTKKQKAGNKRRYITLTAISDESQSEDETVETTLPCQYKIGVSLLRQAYERLIEAGLKGLTQIEMAQLLGIEFYTSRTLCRVLKSHHIVREYLEDKGKQRTARFVAVAATGKLDIKYAQEKKKFMEYLDKQTTCVSTGETPSTSADNTTDSIYEDPAKTVKCENNDIADSSMTTENIENVVTEIKVLDGCESALNKSLMNSKKTLTLRQLRFANGILKVINQKLTITGYQTLSHLVSQEINEPPMDAKALKAFIQKLVTDKQLKIMKVKWPGFQHKYTVLICAPHIKTTDPIIRAKYKEITLKAFSNKKIKVKQEPTKKPVVPATQVSYPRFMRIRIFHEFLLNFAHFDPVSPESHDLPAGFVSVIDMLPELTVEFALGNISNHCKLAANNMKISEGVLELKLRDAPPELYKTLLQSKSLHNTLRFNLKVLAMLGLIQLIYQPAVKSADYYNIGLSSFLFYVNRNAKIIDTTGTWPRANRVDTGTLEKLYHFDSINDVRQYWNVVYTISTNTTITVKQREKKNLQPPVRVESEVSTYDNGDRYGDGNGPCGFDSCFYMDLPRLWSTYIIRATKNQKQIGKKVAIKLPKLETYKKQRMKKPKKGLPKQVVEKVKTNIKLTRRRQGDLQINWSEQEDNIIMMCKAAITIMSPSSQPGCLKVRNIVAKDILSINDPKKTQSACHRRAMILESNATLAHEKECILNEMRRRRNLIQKHEGLLKKIRIRYPTNLSRFMNEARVPMLELVWVINQLVQSKSYSQKVPCVAINIEAFHDGFTIVPSTANKSCSIYKSSECAVLKEAIILTVMHSYNNEMKSEIAKKIYTLFKTYPENMLRQAIEQLRKCGAIAAKEKLVNNNLHRINLEDLVQSSYKISANYQRRWICRLNSEFINQLGEVLVTEVPQSGVIGSPEINCLFCELHASDVLEIVSTTIPVIAGISGSRIQEEQINGLDTEVKIKLKSGTLGWKPKHNMNMKILSECYKTLQYDVFETLSRNSIVNTKGCNLQSEDKIVPYLRNKAEEGATFQELQENCGYDTKTLIKKLLELESKNIVKRVGFHNNIIVLIEYVKPWTLNIGNKCIVPSPWLTVDSEVRYDVFLKWAGIIMNKIFECPGCSITFLSDTCEFLAARSIQDVCLFLEKCECVKIHTLRPPVPDLFSDDDIFLSELEEFNEYESPENLLLFPVINSLSKYAFYRKKIVDHFNVK